MFVAKLARMYTLNAIEIQRMVRGHLARRGEVRALLEANYASRVITRVLRAHAVSKVQTGMVGGIA